MQRAMFLILALICALCAVAIGANWLTQLVKYPASTPRLTSVSGGV